jgi:hypothetical protein
MNGWEEYTPSWVIQGLAWGTALMYYLLLILILIGISAVFWILGKLLWDYIQEKRDDALSREIDRAHFVRATHTHDKDAALTEYRDVERAWRDQRKDL